MGALMVLSWVLSHRYLSQERLIVAHLMMYINDNSILPKKQFRFRKFYSSADQLIITYNEVTDMIDKGKSVDLVLFEFAKAFDTVCHTVLMFKFQLLVDPTGISIGVNAVLLYVNHLTKDVKCPFKVFADGIKLYIGFGFDKHDEYVIECQSDIDLLVSESSSWGLNMNVNKCKVIRFSHRNSNLPFSGPSSY